MRRDREEMTCQNCRFWKRYDSDTGTGVCTSVLVNDYSGAILVTERGQEPEHFVVLQTNEDHSCADWRE